MSSKSLFNKALIKKDFKILLPVFIGNLLYLIIAYPFRYSQLLSKLKEQNDLYIINSIYSNSRMDADFIIYIFAILTAIILFANEKGKKTIEVIAVAPFSRKQIYINKILVAFLTIIIPTIIIFIVNYFIISSNPFFNSIINMVRLKTIYIYAIIIQFLMISYYIMISMFFGGAASTFICGTILTFIPSAPLYMLRTILNNAEILDNIAKISEKYTPFQILLNLLFKREGAIYLLLFAIIMIVAGYFLFEVYKMEKNSEFLTFRFTEPVFKIGFFICSSLLFTFILMFILDGINELSFVNKMVGFIIGAVFGYIVPKVIISRNKVA